MFIRMALQGRMCINFTTPLELVGCDEYSVYLLDKKHVINGVPYVRAFSKDWHFIDAFTGCEIGFEVEPY